MITNRAFLALAACAEMAESGNPVTVRTLADKTGMSMSYIEQICGTLRDAGIIAGVRGLNGGYRLTDAPDRITALQIIGAASRRHRTPADDLPPHPAVALLSNQIQTVMAEIGLSDLTIPTRAAAP